jgi:hypothetical protein
MSVTAGPFKQGFVKDKPCLTGKLTPKTLSRSALSKGKTGLVFTRAHVMPMIHGQVSNFNGHGDEPIAAVATYSYKP